MISETVQLGTEHAAISGGGKVLRWKDFSYGGQLYCLDHLDSFTMECERPAKGNRSHMVFTVDVTFSLHCFTEQLPTARFDPKLKYSDARETRMFCFERYRLSKLLPDIIRTLATRQCLHAGRGNFVTVQIAGENGTVEKYHVFFEPSKSSTKGRINLYVQSGYIPSRDVAKTRMPMNFLYILHNTLNSIPFRS